MTDAQTLLAEYARTGSEAAFRDLVKRYIGLVYSSALRLVHGDTHLAEDVTQLVFIDLARKARGVSTEVMLGGWLHQRTYNIAAPIQRAERRRHAREKEAVQMNALDTDPDTRLAQVAPILDEAITRLGRDDRKAIILRFFEQRDYRSIGEALGTSDDAAQKRVTRAVAKLHAQLISRGVTLSAAAIAAALTSQTLTAAPAGLAASVARTALAGAASGTGSTLALLKYMATTKLKTGIIGAFIASGVLIVLFLRQGNNNSAEQSNSPQLSTSENASGSAVTRHLGDSASSRFSRSEADVAPAATAQEIVTGKLVRFGKSRRSLVDALARRHGVEVPDAVKLFFDAVESGNWDDIEARFNVINGGDSSAGHAAGRPPGVELLWPAIIDAYGAAEQAHLWPAQKLLEYGNAILDSLRTGMVYVGGTDNGRWIPELLNDTSEGERHIVVTQNGLADRTYLDYLSLLYSECLATLTPEESKRVFQEYVADAQRRLQHDQQFPDEPKQMRPGEDIRGTGDQIQVIGVGWMAVNENLLHALMQKNPELSFALEESFPLKSTYGAAVPLGPLMELGVQDAQNVFDAERAAQSLDYWRTITQNVLADPEALGSPATIKSYSHDANSAANLLAAHNYNAEAEAAYHLSSQLCPYNPEPVAGLAQLLARAGRSDQARQLLDDFARGHPDQRSMVDTFRGSIIFTVPPDKP